MPQNSLRIAFWKSKCSAQEPCSAPFYSLADWASVRPLGPRRAGENMEKQGKTACKRPVDSSKASFLAFSAAAILDGTSKSVTVQWPGQDLHLGAFKMAVSGPLSAVRALAEARAAAKHLCNEQSLGKSTRRAEYDSALASGCPNMQAPLFVQALWYSTGGSLRLSRAN